MWFEQAVGIVTGDQQEARDVLATYGLRLVSQDDAEWLAVAISHQGLAALFAHTHWAARSGASGVWSQSLRRVPGARNSAHSIRFRGWQGRAVLIPLAHLRGGRKGVVRSSLLDIPGTDDAV